MCGSLSPLGKDTRLLECYDVYSGKVFPTCRKIPVPLSSQSNSTRRVTALKLSDTHITHLTPNDHISGRTATLTSRCCIFYLFNKYTTEYFKHAAYSLFFSSSKCRLFHNATFFGSCIIHISYTECAEI